MELTHDMLIVAANDKEMLDKILNDFRKKGVHIPYAYAPMKNKEDLLQDIVSKLFPEYNIAEFKNDLWNDTDFAIEILYMLENNIRQAYHNLDFWKSFPADGAVETVLDLSQCYFSIIKKKRRGHPALIEFVMPMKGTTK